MKKYSFTVQHPIMPFVFVTIAFVSVIFFVLGIIYLIENIEVHERIS